MTAIVELTERQRETLHCLCSGLNTKEAADRLGVSPKTIEYHRVKLYEILLNGRSNQFELLAIGIRMGFGDRKCLYCGELISPNAKPWTLHCSAAHYKADWEKKHPKSGRQRYLRWVSKPGNREKKIRYMRDWKKRKLKLEQVR